MKNEKTNVMRILDKTKVSYSHHFYDDTLVNAVEVAHALGQDPLRLYKTLVTVGKSGTHYVFMVPGEMELDLKKAAKVAGEKSLEMIAQKELLPLTGYIHGGCSPIGMKKQFASFIDSSAAAFDAIYFSGGKVGCQIEMPLSGLEKIIRITTAPIAKEKQADAP